MIGGRQAEYSGCGRPSWSIHTGFGIGLGRLGPAVKRADLKHLSDRGNAGNRLFGEFTDPERERARKFSVKIHRAAAHAGDHARILGLLPAQPDENYVAL